VAVRPHPCAEVVRDVDLEPPLAGALGGEPEEILGGDHAAQPVGIEHQEPDALAARFVVGPRQPQLLLQGLVEPLDVVHGRHPSASNRLWKVISSTPPAWRSSSHPRPAATLASASTTSP